MGQCRCDLLYSKLYLHLYILWQAWGMKAYGLDLRERIVSFVNAGGSKVEAARRFGVARKTVYNYLALVKAGALAPKASWGTWKKFEPAKVRAYGAQHPDATLWEIGRAFHGTDVGALSALRLLGITLKKTRKIPGKKGGAAVAVSAGARSLGGPGGFLPGRMWRGASVASGIWPRPARGAALRGSGGRPAPPNEHHFSFTELEAGGPVCL